jgi:cytochrome c-type biogenesis protein CcmH/NrfF
MRRLRNRTRNSLLVLALAAAPGFAQSAEELESPAVNRVAEKLLCPCGCKMNMACRMEPYPCRTCWDNKKKILKLQAAGLSDQAILATFAQEQGKEVVANPPGLMGSLSMYSAAILGLLLVVWVIRRYSRKGAVAGAPAAHDAELDRYHDQIEKEVEKLD